MIVVFMVAGMSSRFYGNPKHFAIVGPAGETLIEYSIHQALEAAKDICTIDKIVFITNGGHPHTPHVVKSNPNPVWDNIIERLNKECLDMPKLEFVQQKYDTNKRIRPWGTNGAVCSLLGNIDQSFIIVNGDDIYGTDTFKEGYKTLLREKNNIIGGCKMIDTFPEEGYVNRGYIETDNCGNVIGMKELLKISKKTNPELHDSLGNVNFIGLLPKTVELLNTILLRFQKEHENDEKIECLLPDNLNELLQTKQITMKFFQIKNKIYGITNPGDEIILRNILIQQ